jgi:hypothetical protein
VDAKKLEALSLLHYSPLNRPLLTSMGLKWRGSSSIVSASPTVHEQMYEYVNKQGLMYDFHLGFRKTYSTESRQLYLTDFIRKEIDEGNLCGTA